MTAPRGLGGVDAVDALLPGWVDVVAAGVTQLGSVPVLGVILAARYWLGARREGAVGLAALVAAHALTTAVKAVLALPRPPSVEWLVAAGGYGFPSGHALTATVVWGYLAVTLGRGERRTRRVGAAILVVAIALSRVVLGVHYVVDVVAGVATGLVLLAVLLRWARGSPLRAFGLAGTLAAVAALVAAGPTTALLLGVGIGAGATWRGIEIPASGPRGRGVAAMVGLGIGSAALLAAVYVAVASPALAFVAGGIVGAGVVGAPALPGWLVVATGSAAG